MTIEEFNEAKKHLKQTGKAKVTRFFKYMIREIINRELLSMHDANDAIAIARELELVLEAGLEEGPDKKDIIWTLQMVSHRYKIDIALWTRIMNAKDSLRNLFKKRHWRKITHIPELDRIVNFDGEYDEYNEARRKAQEEYWEVPSAH